MSELNQSFVVDNTVYGPAVQNQADVEYTVANVRKTIAVFWSNRSEEGLLRPVIEELKRYFIVQEYKVPDDPYDALTYLTSLDIELPDYAIVPYDRPPMAMVAFICFHMGVPIIQLQAGDISSGTWDDQDRWAISNWATYHFCAGRKQAVRLKKFLRTMGRSTEYVYVSGVTNLDDIDKMTEAPDGDYDVVIYNVPTKCPETIDDDLRDIVNRLDKDTYWIEPQGTTAYDKDIAARVDGFTKTGKAIFLTPTMPHESLLGLLSCAKRVIGNSSVLYLEAPYFGCEIVPIGERNKIRETAEVRPGGSRRIARRLKKWLT